MRLFKFICSNIEDVYMWKKNPVQGETYDENQLKSMFGDGWIGVDDNLFSEDWEVVELSFQELRDNIVSWAKDKNLLKPENQFKQFAKTVEELGELGRGILKNDPELISDSIGDTLVTLIILSDQLGLNPVECLELAWNEIKDRKGRNLNGTFIKD